MQMNQNSLGGGMNNGWSGMIATQNLQPAPGSNPFFNLTAQQQQTALFATQVSKCASLQSQSTNYLIIFHSREHCLGKKRTKIINENL